MIIDSDHLGDQDHAHLSGSLIIDRWSWSWSWSSSWSLHDHWSIMIMIIFMIIDAHLSWSLIIDHDDEHPHDHRSWSVLHDHWSWTQRRLKKKLCFFLFWLTLYKSKRLVWIHSVRADFVLMDNHHESYTTGYGVDSPPKHPSIHIVTGTCITPNGWILCIFWPDSTKINRVIHTYLLYRWGHTSIYPCPFVSRTVQRSRIFEKKKQTTNEMKCSGERQ